jgi:hypothetical protein
MAQRLTRGLSFVVVYPWKQTQVAVDELGVALRSLEVRDPKDIESAYVTMAQDRPDALIVLQDALTLQHRKRSSTSLFRINFLACL